MNEHTPGPWRWVYAYQCRGTHWCLENDQHARMGLTIDHRLVTLGTEEYDYDDDGNATRLDQTPNFRLIAAAPDLLAACQAAMHALRSYQHGNSATALAKEVADELAAVIAKVKPDPNVAASVAEPDPSPS